MFAGLNASFAHCGDRSGLTAVFGWNRWAEGTETPGGQRCGRWVRPFAGRFSGTSTDAPLQRQELPQTIIES